MSEIAHTQKAEQSAKQRQTAQAVENPVAAAKLDPETLVLRASPARGIRFKRGAIAGLLACVSFGVVALAWMALRPQSSAVRQAADPPEVSGDALNVMPERYDKIPKLGPPLPGDLGRPILAHQREMATEGTSGSSSLAKAVPDSGLDAHQSARESALLFQLARREAPGDPAGVDRAESRPQPAEPRSLALDPEQDPNSQQRKSDFIGTMDGRADINPHALRAPASPFTVSAGSTIAASLITGLRSDLPGFVTAQVTEPIYDSATGRILLIPQGARLIGAYDSVIAFGQSRALLVWQRLILPNGSSLRIDNAPATDPAGYAGLADKVDFHTWSLLKGIALSTLLGVGSNLTFSGDSDLVQAIRLSTENDVSRAGSQITSRNLNIQPTITIRPGALVRLVAHKDLILAPWRG